MAADVDEQRGVVDDRPRLLVEADALCEPKRDQALAQDVLHRLPEAEVDPEREPGDELRQAHLCAIGSPGHTPRLVQLDGLRRCFTAIGERALPGWERRERAADRRRRDAAAGAPG